MLAKQWKEFYVVEWHFNPQAWPPTPYGARGAYVAPPGTDNPFAVASDQPSPWQPAPLPKTLIPLYVPNHAAIVALDAEGLDKGRELDLPPPVRPPVIPGIVGELIEACWNAAPWQVAEVAVASALSTMSLLTSRTYRHGTLGLSLYLLVLAKTSTGKSFAYAANDRWFTELQRWFESIKPPHYEEAKARLAQTKSMIIGELGSAQGLAQHMPISPSTLFHADEWVETIKLMGQNHPPAHIAQLKAELLRLMEMSSVPRIYRGRKYSKRSGQQDEVDVLMASLSILATGTPEAFYNDLSPELIMGGFMPRFTILEYEGNLCRPNLNPVTTLKPELMESIKALFNQSYERGKQLTGALEEVINVQCANDRAEAKLKWFENLCIRSNVEANDRDLPTGGLWSRAKEHVRQIASLIAIGVNMYQPRIEAEYVEIAIKIVLPSVEKICAKFDTGEVGISDDRRQAEIRRYIAKLYVGGSQKHGKLSGLKAELLDNGIIQAYVVRNYCRHLSAFKNHTLGSSRAFNDAWGDLIKYGELIRQTVNGKDEGFVTLNMDIFGPIVRSIARGK